MLFEVIYTPEMESELMTLWINSPARQDFNEALNRIDQFLSSNPRKHGYEVAEELFAIEVTPLKAFFEIHEHNSSVVVTAIAHLDP